MNKNNLKLIEISVNLTEFIAQREEIGFNVEMFPNLNLNIEQNEKMTQLLKELSELCSNGLYNYLATISEKEEESGE